MESNGKHFKETLIALKLDKAQGRETTVNATNIVEAVLSAYGKTAGGDIDPTHIPSRPVTGLVYGRIQSGKTRAMIASTAMAFDNKFRIAVVMTSNINDLVNQTHFDFSTGLPGLMIFTKDNNLKREVENAKLHLEMGDGGLLLVCSKAKKSLQNVSEFLTDIGGDKYPAIIFDDEGDQASLDTNTRRRSSSGIAVAPSKINQVIQNKLRTSLKRHVYVSVTGTPQAVLLQSAESSHRPSFIVMLPPGQSYVGGDRFFAREEPEDNPGLIALVSRNEKQQLLGAGPIPPGLKKSLLFFLVSAAAAIRNLGPRERGYSYLCHPSLRNNEQQTAENRINGFLIKVAKALYGTPGGDELLSDLKSAHAELRLTLKDSTPTFEEIRQTILQHLPTKRLLVINASVKRRGIEYGRGLNFLIGGNTLGRGIAIRDLLVTYYVRDSKISQIDTMHQHARMYGYRSETIRYTRLFITKQLYYRFRDIHRSDEDLRAFIQKHQANPSTFPIEYTFGLRTTRPGVLDVKKTDTLSPGQHIFPNYIALPQSAVAYDAVLNSLCTQFGLSTVTEGQLERASKAGVIISADTATALIKGIKTKSQNTWRDTTIAEVIKKVASKFHDEILLRFRTAERRVDAGGFISTGTLYGGRLTEARNAANPTLWIMAATTKADSAVGAGLRFMYPSFVIPDSFPNLVMFNRGK